VVGDALEVLGDHDVAKLGVGLLAVGFHESKGAEALQRKYYD
jgi:hypothetical protein